MKNPIRSGAVLLLVSLLAACASTSTPSTTPSPEATPPSGAQTSPATPPKSAAELEQDAKRAAEQTKRMQLLTEEVIYFEYDSASISDHSRAVIEAHSAYILENPDVSMELAGHCDERGTREYNLALGERRAQAVQKLMTAFGVPAKQVRVVSFGEEKPIDPEHNEAAWKKNRRAELIYKLK
ncbi:MAG TPA: peptidoglycan-associated lipoprotein Pal [Burkholderiales bacterium]|nr:peptidoglycan-associated lipoprotein Pal [Burkholderiales bacterium]